MAEDPKSPLDQVLDLLVFAPVGLALTAKDELPSLVSKGRQRVANQVVLARMIGQFAVVQGQKEAEKAAGRLAEQASTVASRLGGFPGIPGPSVAVGAPDARPSEGQAASSGATGALQAAGAPSAAAPSRPPITPPAPPAPVAPRPAATAPANGSARPAASAAPAGTSSRSSSLAIPGYDSLSASQVVQRLAGLAPEELEAVRSYEASTRGRRTILSKVGQLQADRS